VRLRFLHRSPLDGEQAVESGRLVRSFHFRVGAAGAEERVRLVLGKALHRLAHRLVHGGERGARRRRQAIAELRHLGSRHGEGGEAVRRREGHQRRRQALADEPHFLGIAGVDEQHVGTGTVERVGAPQRLVEIVDAARIGAGDDHEAGVGACRDRLLDLVDHQLGGDEIVDPDVVLDAPR
jgi:hypothetical protein